ncbi:MAG: hypothetical protein NC416_13990 [Eubacterium sp.]|nr:hypothetical protein [Eubacterium sp.]
MLEQLVKSCLPFITRKYWFYSCYVCLFLLSGYIQKFMDHLKQKEFEKLLFLLLVLFSFFPTLFYFELIPDNGKGLFHMIMVYMIGRYIRMYRDVRLPKKAGLIVIVLWIINGVSHEIPIEIGGIYHHLCKDNSITNLTMAVIVFYLFKEMNFRSRFVNKAASNVFAVFALNDAMVTVVMSLLFESGFCGKDGMIGFLILTGVVVFILLLCLMIGELRTFLLGKADKWLGNLVERKVMEKVTNLYFWQGGER